MHDLCHRCGAELPAGTSAPPFCPHCGAPQLLLSEYSEPLSTGSTTGALPPPLLNPIDWQSAIECTLAVAAIAAVLDLVGQRVDVVSLLSTVWVLTASMTVLALYHRRRPLATMNVRIGTRIGVLVGTLLGVFLAIAKTAAAVITRFSLHRPNEFDEMAAMMKLQWADLAASHAIDPTTAGLIASPEFRAATMLLGLAVGLLLILLISICGGALGGFLRSRSRTAA